MEIIKFENLTDSATTEAINKIFLNNGFLLTRRSNKYTGHFNNFYHNYKLGNLYVGFEVIKNTIKNLKLSGNCGYDFLIKTTSNEIHIDISSIINCLGKINERRNENKIIKNVSKFKEELFKSWIEGLLSDVKEDCFNLTLDINNSSYIIGELYNQRIKITNKPISKKIFSEIDFDDVKFSLEVGPRKFVTNKPLKNIINILKNFKKLISEIEKTKQSYINELVELNRELNKKIEEQKQQISKRMSERDKKIINIINDYSKQS